MLLGALRLFYASIGSFAAAALTSLIGAALLGTQLRAVPATFEAIALARIAVRSMTDEATLLGAYFAKRTKTP
jgi:hypothetical protein